MERGPTGGQCEARPCCLLQTEAQPGQLKEQEGVPRHLAHVLLLQRWTYCWETEAVILQEMEE